MRSWTERIPPIVNDRAPGLHADFFALSNACSPGARSFTMGGILSVQLLTALSCLVACGLTLQCIARDNLLGSERFLRVVGYGADGQPSPPSAIWPAQREWAPLGADMAHEHASISTVAVAGGMLLVSVDEDDDPNELYDEQNGRWFRLPHAMVQPRDGTGLVSVRASALAPLR